MGRRCGQLALSAGTQANARIHRSSSPTSIRYQDVCRVQNLFAILRGSYRPVRHKVTDHAHPVTAGRDPLTLSALDANVVRALSDFNLKRHVKSHVDGAVFGRHGWTALRNMTTPNELRALLGRTA